MADKQNIGADSRWAIGSDKQLRFTIYQADEQTTPRVAQDITGWSLEWVLRDRVAPYGFVQITKTTGNGITLSDAANGVCTVTIDDTDAGGLGAGVYTHALRRTDAGAEDVLSFGTVELIRAAAPA